MFQSIESHIPLAERVRPETLADVVGHSSIIGKGSVLRNALDTNRTISFILWGPPGVGKTTISRLIAKEISAHFISLSAVTSGVKDLRDAIEKARLARQKLQKTTVLFIDEIHRFNKSQQDALLHAVENGTLMLVGATTENPSFEVNAALLSRMHVYKMGSLGTEDLEHLVQRAISTDNELKKLQISFEDISYLFQLSGGDGRKCLTLLDNALALAVGSSTDVQVLNLHLKQSAESIKSAYDKKADYHYDTISAFIKSIRGSDPDAAVLWLARMLDGGEDPVFIARRLLIAASEDIGNADPTALILATNALTAVKSIGMPEARIILSQVTTYLASTSKSNAAYLAIDAAIFDIKNHPVVSVPLHLRNAPTQLMKNEGYGDGYLYPHNYPHHFTPQNYFPTEIQAKSYYIPTDNGREKSFRDRLKAMWKRLV